MWKFLTDNKDVLGLLLGIVLGGMVPFTLWLIKEYRLRRIRTNDNFPFKIILPNSNVAKEILGGADDDPLADRNIPYQQRIQGRNTRRELEELIEDNRWILITGRTGLGKTREAVQLAQSLNNEGWTILYLTREAWLDAPAKLPTNVPERKLLFFLDDLNKKCLSSKAEIHPDAKESLTLPIYEPFQTRLQRTLEAFDIFCGKNEIKVIATARNENTSEFDEPSEWDKLGWTKYNGLWEKFKLADLPEPDKTAEERLLADTAEKANIYVDTNELAIFAKKNDGTFRNLVENLSSAKAEGLVLSSENFRDTLKGTWQKRYQKAIHKYPDAKHLYDAIELLREIDIQIRFSTVIQVAEIISDEKFSHCIKSRSKYSSALKYLIKTENLLHPRDDQIEAKGYRVDKEKYLPAIYKQICINFARNREYTLADLLTLNLLLMLIPKSAFNPLKRLSVIEKLICILLDLADLMHFTGIAYSRAGFPLIAETIYHKALEIKNANLINRALNKHTIASSWNSLGVNYYALERYNDAIQAYNKAINIHPKMSTYWANLGVSYLACQLFDDGIIAFSKSLKLNPKHTYSIIALALCQMKIGNNEVSEQLLSSVEGRIRTRSEYYQACFHIIKGNIEEGLVFLKRGLDKQQTSRSWAQKEPCFETIRNNPRFKELVGLE